MLTHLNRFELQELSTSENGLIARKYKAITWVGRNKKYKN
jgi:hypothetical protein